MPFSAFSSVSETTANAMLSGAAESVGRQLYGVDQVFVPVVFVVNTSPNSLI